MKKGTLSLLAAVLALSLLSGGSQTQARESENQVERRPTAIFEPHGESLCASGCALSRHPTPDLAVEHFHQLMRDYSVQPMTEESAALEELLFFGPQTEAYLDAESFEMDQARLEFLRRELSRDQVAMEFRIIDQDDVVRVSLPPTVVPFDRRYVFDPLLTEDFQPPEASGTVKRVGLRHIWQRI